MSHKANDIYDEYWEEMQEELRMRNYENQLRSVWLKMVRNYPHLYTMDSYFDACTKAGMWSF
jgi:hypothetical protein